MSEEEEARQGKDQIKEFLKAYGGEYPDPAVTDYVNRVGQRMVAVSEMSERPFRFYVANSFVANAFALPGGYIAVTRGLLTLLGDEAELAAVLAHEVGHVTARHAAQGVSRETALGLAATLLSPFTLGLSELMHRGGKVYMRSYDRDEEREADRLALRYLTRAGYNPTAVSRFLDKLHRHGKLMSLLTGRNPHGDEDDTLSNWMATHPPTPERVEATMVAAKAIGDPVTQPDQVVRERYFSAINGMLFLSNPFFGRSKVRIVEVKVGDSLETLADGFPIAHTGTEWLAVMNGLQPGEQPIPGSLFKIIAYY